MMKSKNIYISFLLVSSLSTVFLIVLSGNLLVACFAVIFFSFTLFYLNSLSADFTIRSMKNLPFPVSMKKVNNAEKPFMKEVDDGIRVLLVDDNKTIQLVVGNILRQMGCRVDSVFNGVEACRATQNEPYDIILMDWLMPVMDGATASHKIHTVDSYNFDTPIVALLGDVDKGFGSSPYINSSMKKPLSKTSLQRMLTDFKGSQLLEQRY